MENSSESETKVLVNPSKTDSKKRFSVESFLSGVGCGIALLFGCLYYTQSEKTETPNILSKSKFPDVMAHVIAAQVMGLGFDNIKSTYADGDMVIKTDALCVMPNTKEGGCEAVMITFRESGGQTTKSALVQKDGKNLVVTWTSSCPQSPAL